MAIFNGAFPILPGKVEAARAFAAEVWVRGARIRGSPEALRGYPNVVDPADARRRCVL